MDPLGLGPRPQPMEAVYTKSSVPQFRGNRLIEALPDYLAYSTKAIQEGLSSTPEPLEGDASRKQRAMWLMEASDSLFTAEGRQLKLFEIIDLVIRTGYQRRNPDRPENAKYQSEAYKRQQSGDKVVANSPRSTPSPSP